MAVPKKQFFSKKRSLRKLLNSRKYLKMKKNYFLGKDFLFRGGTSFKLIKSQKNIKLKKKYNKFVTPFFF